MTLPKRSLEIFPSIADWTTPVPLPHRNGGGSPRQ
jgi:hypothetical protein